MRRGKAGFAEVLLPTGWSSDIEIAWDGEGILTSVSPATSVVSGIAIPAIANVHSHAHQRLMAGLAEKAGPTADSFWTWRETMYRFALRLGPEDLEAVAAQLYVEMLKAGFTVVGEFHYLHHQPDGQAYDNPAEFALRCIAAADRA